MNGNLEYSVSLDVARALRDIGNLAAALEGRLVQAVGRARQAVATLDQMRVRTSVDAAGSGRASLPASRSAVPAALAFGAGAAARALTLPAPAANARPGQTMAGGGAAAAASSAIVAAREIAAEARAAFAPLRLALSRLALPAGGSGGGASRPALPGRGGSGRGVIDIDATVISETAKSASGLPQVFRRALAPVRSLLDDLRERARGIVAKVDVGGALRNLGSLLGGLGKVREEVRKTHEESQKGGGIISGVGGAARSALAPLAALAAGYLSLSFAAHQFGSAIDHAAQFEQTKVGFTVLLQSGAKAKAMLADLSKFADTTPFHMPELAQAARTLLAFGDPAQNVMKDLRQLGDVAAGVQAPIGEIAELFGKARTEGTLFSIDIRELTRRGIPIIGELAKQFHVSENAIHGMAETGRIKFADLQTAIGNLTSRGGMFFGMLAAQGQTFKGMVTTLGDAWGALQREFGTPILEPLKAGVGAITAILAGWKDRAHEWGQTLSNVLKGAMAIIQNGDAGTTLGAALKLGFAEAVNVLYKGSVATISALITGLSAG